MNKDALIEKYTYRLGSDLGLWPYMPGHAKIETNPNFKVLKDYLWRFYSDAIDDYLDELTS